MQLIAAIQIGVSAPFSVPKICIFVEFFALFWSFLFEKTLPHTTGTGIPPLPEAHGVGICPYLESRARG
jgi:hypothetical protein